MEIHDKSVYKRNQIKYCKIPVISKAFDMGYNRGGWGGGGLITGENFLFENGK